MRYTYGKTLGGLLAALCLVSTLAVAGEMPRASAASRMKRSTEASKLS